MKNKRKYNVISLILNVSVVYLTIFAMVYNFMNINVDSSWFGVRGFSSLRYFTVLSNLFVAACAILVIIFNIKGAVTDKFDVPKVVYRLKFISTISVTITFLTVVLFLGPYIALSGYNYFSLFSRNNFILHFLTPVLAIICLLFFEQSKYELKIRDVFLSLIPIVAYSIVYFIMVVPVGEENGGWPDFYGFTFGGKIYLAPASIFGMYTASFVISLIVTKLKKLIRKKQSVVEHPSKKKNK